MFDKIINKIKGWWKNMFDYNKIISDFGLDTETSKEMLDAIQNWSRIFNGNEPWIDKDTISLHVAKTMCEKVAKAVTIEFKSECDDEYINNVYQKFLKNKRKNTEYAIGKSCIFFKPSYENNKINITTIQADKFIPVKFDDSGDLLGAIFIDQITDGNDIYTRLEYDELNENILTIKNIAYKGKKNGVILANKIDLHSVNKWKEIDENLAIEGVDRLIGGFFTMNNTNNVDNNSPLGVSLFHNAIDTLKEIDKQFSRTLWEYEGSELAIDIDETMLPLDKKGNLIYPKGKQRLYRKLIASDDDKNKWNIFSPEIRDTALFNGLNELLRQVELQCGLAVGTLCKPELIEKTATEIKTGKQDYYVTVSDIQTSLQQAFEDLIYGIYVLCKLYGIPVSNNYKVTFDWDDSILVDKESLQRQSLTERNADIIDDIQYIMETRDYSEEEAIAFYDNIQKRKTKYQQQADNEPIEE
ncbi:MAG: phage capsid protein [Clostridia bacterium]